EEFLDQLIAVQPIEQRSIGFQHSLHDAPHLGAALVGREFVELFQVDLVDHARMQRLLELLAVLAWDSWARSGRLPGAGEPPGTAQIGRRRESHHWSPLLGRAYWNDFEMARHLLHRNLR